MHWYVWHVESDFHAVHWYVWHVESDFHSVQGKTYKLGTEYHTEEAAHDVYLALQYLKIDMRKIRGALLEPTHGQVLMDKLIEKLAAIRKGY